MQKRTSSHPAGEQETVQRLLDTAERLFGEHGYDGVGLRMLAAEAKVNLGAATYHFGSKEALYIETFMRRFRPTNVERLRLLHAAETKAKGAPLTVETIIDCMIRPPYQLGLTHPNFNTLLARSLFMPPSFLQAALHRELEPNAKVFIAAFCRSLPSAPEDLIRLRVMFLMGALLMFSIAPHRIREASNQKHDESILKELVRFGAAGLQSAPAVNPADRSGFPHPFKPARA
jgi:AcrR family transcriptional regulator